MGENKEGHITVLEGLQPVRVRPAMYIGSTDTRGLHHLVYEVVDNSVDESLAGHCDRIFITLNSDGSCSVLDNGRGIPVYKMEKTGKSALETALTVLHAGGKFDKDTYQVSGGLHGVGVSVVNALSINLSATVYRDGKVYSINFSQGKTKNPMEVREETLLELVQRYKSTYGEGTHVVESDRDEFLLKHREKLTGTQIKFIPDPEIFETTIFDYDVLAHRLREMAFLNKNLAISLKDERSGDNETFFYEGGIREF